MTNQTFRSVRHDDDRDCNPSGNASLQTPIDARYSRRAALFGGLSATAAAFGLASCGGGSDVDPDAATIVQAGAAASSSSGRMVTLTGDASGAPGVTFTSGWTQTSGPTVALMNAQSSAASFIAPAVAAATPLGFRFTATSSTGQVKAADTTVTVGPAQLGFNAVAKNLNDVVTVPAGYSVTVLYRLGDPIAAGVPAFANDGTDANYAQRAGDHHDGMYYFGLAASGNTRDDASNGRGLLAINHENITEQYLHVNGALTVVSGARTVQSEVDKEIEAHGVAVIEVLRAANGAWSYVQTSPLNRRITPNTPMAINGPVRGAAQLRTRFSPTGVAGRGTVNNCANGYAPWGTYLTCEENWAGYFNRRPTTAPHARPKRVSPSPAMASPAAPWRA